MKEEKIESKGQSSFQITGLIFFLVSLLILFMFFPALLIILSIGMMPTLGAVISDPTSNRAQSTCVGFCNISGLVPALHQLYLNNFSLASAYVIIHDEFYLLYILGISAMGWALFFIIPSIAVSMYRSRDKFYLIRMVKRYKDLKEIWGDALPDSEILTNSKGMIKSSHDESDREVA
jgi:zona occludens toxin (predicted ATPase)